MLGEGIIADPDVAKFTIGYSLTMAHEDETSNGHVVLFSLSNRSTVGVESIAVDTPESIQTGCWLSTVSMLSIEDAGLNLRGNAWTIAGNFHAYVVLLPRCAYSVA
jgi:hypothetical protein